MCLVRDQFSLVAHVVKSLLRVHISLGGRPRRRVEGSARVTADRVHPVGEQGDGVPCSGDRWLLGQAPEAKRKQRTVASRLHQHSPTSALGTLVRLPRGNAGCLGSNHADGLGDAFHHPAVDINVMAVQVVTNIAGDTSPSLESLQKGWAYKRGVR